MTIAIILAVLAILLLSVMKSINDSSQQNQSKTSSSTRQSKPVIKMLNREGDVQEDEWHTYIAGLSHHASKYNIGGFTGIVANDVNNTRFPDAMGVYNSSGKLLGYIPAKDLNEYREWCDAMPQPCVGFIFEEDGELRGRVKILRPCNEEFIQQEFTRYLQWVNDNYGKKYLPPTMSMQFDIN